MKKKKLVLLSAAAVLSLAVAGSIGATVASAETTLSKDGETSGTTTVTYSVADSWTVTIPDSISVGGAGDSVTASGVKIEQGQKLTVKVTSQNDWKVTDDGTHDGTGYTYELKKDGTKVGEDGTVLEVAAGTDGGSATLTATLNDSNASKYSTGGDSYTDTLTFTVESENAGA